MKTFNLVQGSKEWHDFRDQYDTASEAPVMMGKGYIKRDVFLKNKALGIVEEPSAFLLNLFQKGHDAEEAARPIAEEMFGLEFWPLTGLHDDGKYSASFDGITEDYDVVWEHKLWNEKLADKVREKKLDPKYYWQLEQQMYVSGAEKAIFMVSDGTAENMVWMEYTPVKGRVKKMLAGWEQYHKDLDAFLEENPIEEAKEGELVEETKPAEVIAGLPAIKYEMNGMTLTSNLEAYKEAAMVLVDNSRLIIQTDEDFGRCEQFNKRLKEAEAYIKKTKADVLGEVQSIDDFNTSLDQINALVREARINGEKQVKDRKSEIRLEVIQNAQAKLNERINEMNEGLSGFSLPRVNADFSEAIKGKKTIDSLKSAANDYLAELTSDLNETADLIKLNAIAYKELSAGVEFLFNDLPDLITSDNETFKQLIQGRISTYKVEVAEKAAKQKEIDDAEKLRLEEEASQNTVEDQTQVVDQTAQTELDPAAPMREAAIKPVNELLDNYADVIGDQPVEDQQSLQDPREEPEPNKLADSSMSPEELKQHRFKVHTAIKATLEAYGASPELATELTKLMSKGQIPRVQVIY